MDRNRGSPSAMMLMATPETIWSTWNRIVATAWMAATTTPATMAIRSPVAAPKRSAPQAPNQVPNTIIPSRPMLTTPERSLNSPPRVARNRGVNARMAEAITARPMSWPRKSSTLLDLLQTTAGGGPRRQLERDHDGEQDDALQDGDQLLRDLGAQPDPGRGPVQIAEQQCRPDDPGPGVAPEQGDRDAGEPVAAHVVELGEPVDAEGVLEPDQPGHPARDE